MKRYIYLIIHLLFTISLCTDSQSSEINTEASPTYYADYDSCIEFSNMQSGTSDSKPTSSTTLYTTNRSSTDLEPNYSSGISSVQQEVTHLHAMEQYQDSIIHNHSYARLHTQHLIQRNYHQLSFANVSSKLPPNFTDSFKRRSCVVKWWRSGMTKKIYEVRFNNQIIQKCGYNYTYEQLVQHQYAQMRDWPRYHHDEFLEFVQSFALYSEYILELDQELKNNFVFARNVKDCEPRAYNTIISDANKIRAAQEKRNEYNREQQALIAHDIFKEQEPVLNEQITTWEYCNPDRITAYHAAIENNGRQCIQQYAISQHVETCLLNNALNPSFYKSLHGNDLQHQFLNEIIDGIEQFAQIPKQRNYSLFNTLAHTATIETFEDARKTNEMGDCIGASKLIDLAYTFLDYCTAAVEGAVNGIGRGAVDAVIGICHLVGNPTHILHAFNHLTLQLAYLMHDFIPLNPPGRLFDPFGPRDGSMEEQERYMKEYQRVSNNWHKKYTHFLNWWNKTPTRDKIYKFTNEPAHFITNLMVGNRCLNFIGSACKLAHAEVLALYNSSDSQTVAAAITGLSEALPTSLLNEMSEVEQIAQNPGTKLLNEVQKHSNPAHSSFYYESLKKELKERAHASLEKTYKKILGVSDLEPTIHGLERLIERFTPKEFSALVKKPSFVTTQADGAKVYLRKFGSDKYAFVIINTVEKKVVTALNNLSHEAAIKVGRNHGWTL